VMALFFFPQNSPPRRTPTHTLLKCAFHSVRVKPRSIGTSVRVQMIAQRSVLFLVKRQAIA